MGKIIVIAVNTGIGNILMATPMIEEVKKKFGDSKISVLVSSESHKKLLENNPNIDRIIILKKGDSKLDKFFPTVGVGQLRELRKEGFDISFTIIPHSYYGSFCALWINAKRKISHNLCKADFFQNELVELKRVHDVIQNINLVDSDYKITPSLKIWINENERKKKIKNRVGIHIGSDANSEFKRWPIENFVEVGKKLEGGGFDVVFFMGPDEWKYIERIEREGVFKIIRDRDLRKMIIELNRCEYFIGGDSGVMHIAEALDIPLVAIFGASDYRRTGPMGNEKRIILTPKGYSPWSYSLDDIEKMGNFTKNCGTGGIEKIEIREVYTSLLKLKNKVVSIDE